MAMSDQRLDEVIQHRTPLQPQRLGHAEQALDEAAPLLAVAAERSLPLDHRRPQAPLRRVVRRLHPLLPRERPQRLLQLQRFSAHTPSVLTQPQPDPCSSKRPHFRPQPSVHVSAQPAPACACRRGPCTTARTACRRRPADSSPDGRGRPAPVDHGLEVPPQVCPAHLPPLQTGMRR